MTKIPEKQNSNLRSGNGEQDTQKEVEQLSRTNKDRKQR